MCASSNDRHDKRSGMMGRREFVVAGAGLAVAAPLLGGNVAATQDDREKAAVGTGPIKARAYGVARSGAPIGRMEIERRAMGPNDVLLDVLYCGVCHSDIHTARDEWGPAKYPCVPGHEIVGRVAAVGEQVTKFKVGDIGGVGCMVDSCRTCENCRDDREQNCLDGATFTYDSPDKVGGGHTYGGYSNKMVVAEHFVIRIPPGMDLAATAPLLCAGVTTFSPMQHWKLKAGQRVGIVGLGGLGHMAVKLAVARGADATVFTTTPGKVEGAKKLGAKDAVLSTDSDAMRRHAGKYDLLIATIPKAYPIQPYADLLKLDATLVNVGAMEPIGGIHGMQFAFGRKSFAGSVIGGVAETQEVIDYCAARDIKADIELIGTQDISKAWDRVVNKDVRYRFVIDMTKA